MSEIIILWYRFDTVLNISSMGEWYILLYYYNIMFQLLETMNYNQILSIGKTNN